MKLYEIAHSRAGDKGNILNLSLIPFNEEDYDFLYDKVTADSVKKNLEDVVKGKMVRYEVPRVISFNFDCYDALLGAVSTSIEVDIHGKPLSSALMVMEI